VLRRSHVVCGTLNSFGNHYYMNILSPYVNQARRSIFHCIIMDEVNFITYNVKKWKHNKTLFMPLPLVFLHHILPISVHPWFVLSSITYVPRKQITWNLYSRSGTIIVRSSSISDLTTFSFQELCPCSLFTLAGNRGILILWTHTSIFKIIEYRLELSWILIINHFAISLNYLF